MGFITKIDKLDEFKKGMTAAEIARMAILERELSPTVEMVKLGADWFQIQSFDMDECAEFSKFQHEYREILRKTPNITFDELLRGEDNVVKKIIQFLKIDVEVADISYKQFKYLMAIITKNYMFTSLEDSEYINSMTPFFFV